MNRRHFLQTTLATALATSLPAAVSNRPPRLLLRSSWQVVNIGDIGLDEWLFNFDNHEEIQRLVPDVLAMAKHPETAKAKVAKARAFVQQRQRETMSIVRQSLSG